MPHLASVGPSSGELYGKRAGAPSSVLSWIILLILCSLPDYISFVLTQTAKSKKNMVINIFQAPCYAASHQFQAK